MGIRINETCQTGFDLVDKTFSAGIFQFLCWANYHQKSSRCVSALATLIIKTKQQKMATGFMRDCNVFKYLLYTCHFCESFLYCNNKTTHHRRKYMKSNVLYVVTQGQN